MSKKTILILSIVLAFGLVGKIYYDLDQIRHPPPVLDRDGNTAKHVVLSWEKSLQLAVVYQWNLLGSDSGFINKQVMNTTINAGIKWNKPIPAELRENRILEFARQNQIDTTPWDWEKAPADYQTINEFFAREYHHDSSLHPRHYFGSSAPHQIGSVAEAKIVAYSNVQESQNFWVKNKAFSLEKTGLPDWQQYADHPMAIFRLAPYDYHRFHAPLTGKVVHISSSDEYEDTWSHSVKPMILQHPDFNLFNENRRRFLVLETEFGKIALMFVGAVTVDSITFNTNVKVGQHVTKGEDLGTFNFGGSTIVMFTDSSRFSFDTDILQQSRMQTELQVRCGEVIGSGS